MKGKNHDRDDKKSSKKKSGNHRPSEPNGKVRATGGSNHSAKRAEKKSESPAKTNPAAQKAAPEEALIDRARKWAALHADPRTRGDMDKVFTGLSEPDKRRVRLCGQRIASGLSVKLIK